MALFVLVTVVLHIPFVQNIVGSEVASALAGKLGTRVEVGRVDVGFLNRVIVDNVRIYDQKHKKLLFATRVAAKVDIIPLFEGRVSVSSAQLFGLDANLYRTSKNSPTNFQFVLDSLASKDTTSHKPLDLRIASLVIRNGKARWNDYQKPKGNVLDINHLNVSNLSAHILLNHITDNTIDASVRRLALKEQSGLDLRQLAFKLKTDKHSATMSNLTIELPRSKVFFPYIHASFGESGNKNSGSSSPLKNLKYTVKLAKSYIAPADLGFLDPALRGFSNRLNLQADIDGTSDNINVKTISIVTDDESIVVRGHGGVDHLSGTPHWFFVASPLKTSADGIKYVARNLRNHNIKMPDAVIRLGDIYFIGKANGQGKNISADGDIRTSAGNVTLKAEYNGGKFNAAVKTPGFELGHVLDNKDFGKVIADITAHGVIPNPFRLPALDVTASGNVRQFDYHGYSYRNISVDGTFANETFNGKASIDDPNGKLNLAGTINRSKILVSLDAQHFNPYNLKLTNALGNRSFSMKAKADVTGSDLDHLNGSLDITDFSAIGEGKSYVVNQLHANVRNNFRHRSADVASDFGELHLSGVYDYQTLYNSFLSVLDHHLPSLFPGERRSSGNAFTVHGSLVSAKVLRDILGIPLHFNGPVNINGSVNDLAHAIDLNLTAPEVVYNGNHIKNASISISPNASGQFGSSEGFTTKDGLQCQIRGERVSDNGTPLAIVLNATASNDDVTLNGTWDLRGNTHNYGDLSANVHLFRSAARGLGLSVDVNPSVEVFDTIHVAVQPSHLTYQQNLLNIDHFEVSNGEQHVSVNGQTTGNENDSLLVDFSNINLKYVLDLVGFNSVKFTGLVTGRGYVKSFFKSPKAYANLDIADFRFQGGEFGTLHAKVDYDNNVGRININSVADDGSDCYTNIDGYVSIKEHYINLPMVCHNTKLQFLEGFAGAVLSNVEATGNGTCRIFGDLSEVNMDGDMISNGDMSITQTNTTYTMHNSHIHIVPDEIEFAHDSIYDRDGNLGIITGGIHHHNFHRWTFDIHVEADHLLCLNLPEFGDNTFRGVIYGSGSCDVIGRPNETTINANITPVGKSYMEYDAGYSGALDDNSFIHWKDATTDSVKLVRQDSTARPPAFVGEGSPQEIDIPSDFTMNLLINTTPDFTLRVLMDESNGDHMDFHGDGVIRATYYNKGAFQMFGNYNVEFGNYTMTIQNLVKKNFTFQPGSSITFGGNPFDALLNVKAQYTVNGVSLSDLQMGRSFTSGNIRVNCLMNILGTPLKPNVTFGIDLPTLSSDAQQMVRSVMDSEEDMNQQVLYLLAVGRFYNPGNNNAEIESNASQSRTSLAMQSVLSGTLSQQLSNVLSSVIHNTNWNIGANISTGDEGFSDAEYEGLLSGRMLNNRLFFQGQFGYRDKVTTNNSSFIGDFDLRYLLTPNGNAAIRVYNQTNDRYFTRNSLTTQGIGFILKKDFNTIGDLFTIGNKNKKNKQKKSKKSNKK